MATTYLLKVSLVTWLAMFENASATNLSLWKSWETLRNSWVGASFSFNCYGESYHIDKSVLGALSVSVKGADGNWIKLEDTEFSDTKVRFKSYYTISGQFFHDDVVNLKSVQSLAHELKNASQKTYDEAALKRDSIYEKDKHLAELAVNKCRDAQREKYRPFIEQQNSFRKDDPDFDSFVNQELDIRLMGACSKFELKLTELNFNQSAKILAPPSNPVFDVAVDSSERQGSTSIDFENGSSEFNILDWRVGYKVRITVGNVSKDISGALSPLDEIHTDKAMCALIE
jgi:hypothetical protein